MTRPAPCASCPWRRTAVAAGIPRYDHQRAEGLAGTCGDEDDWRPIMACHGSDDGAETPCVGYLARYGWRNIACRMEVAHGRMPGSALDDPPAEWDLHETFDEMISKLRATRTEGQAR